MRKKNKTLLFLAAGGVGAILVLRHRKNLSLQATGWGIVDMATPYGRGYIQPWGHGTPWNPSLAPWVQMAPYSSMW